MKTSLELLGWNANGLQTRKEKLACYLHHHDIDIALISETHHVGNYTRPKIQNYSVYLANHPSCKAHGGSAIYVKSCLPHITTWCAFITNSIHASVIALQFATYTLRIGSISCLPRCAPEENDFADLLLHLGQKWILGGDLNTKHSAWGSRFIISCGWVFHKICQRFNCLPLSPNSPTNPGHPTAISYLMWSIFSSSRESHNTT